MNRKLSRMTRLVLVGGFVCAQLPLAANSIAQIPIVKPADAQQSGNSFRLVPPIVSPGEIQSQIPIFAIEPTSRKKSAIRGEAALAIVDSPKLLEPIVQPDNDNVTKRASLVPNLTQNLVPIIRHEVRADSFDLLPTEIPIVQKGATSSPPVPFLGVPKMDRMKEDPEVIAAESIPVVSAEIKNGANLASPEILAPVGNSSLEPAAFVQENRRASVPPAPINATAKSEWPEWSQAQTRPNSNGVQGIPIVSSQDVDDRLIISSQPIHQTVDQIIPIVGATSEFLPSQEPADFATCPHCGGVGCRHCMPGVTELDSAAGIGQSFISSSEGSEPPFECFGFMPCADRYLITDGLYWTRNDGEISGTNFGGFSDYEWDYGIRVQAGRRYDSISGTEFMYTGLQPLEQTLRQTSGIGAIDANFTPGGGLGVVQTGAFFNAVETNQSIKTQFHSVELNRVRWGFDVVQTNIGMRYMWFEDDYKLVSRNILGETGTFSLSAVNQLIGPEIGLNLFYDVGRRISFSGFGKLGGYLNFYRTDLDLINNAVQYLSNAHSDTNLSASLDLGLNAHVHLKRGMRLRAGYNAMWLWDVTSSADNFPTVLTTTTGFTPDDTDTVFFHGANVGIEFYR